MCRIASNRLEGGTNDGQLSVDLAAGTTNHTGPKLNQKKKKIKNFFNKSSFNLKLKLTTAISRCKYKKKQKQNITFYFTRHFITMAISLLLESSNSIYMYR